jgi:ATP-binding cassette, subfamily B, bacterial MsbA
MQKLKQRFDKLKYVYALLGPLKVKFWVCVLFISFFAIWEILVLLSITSFFSGVLTEASSATQAEGSISTLFFDYFPHITKEQRPLIGFILAGGSLFIKNILKIGISVFQTKFSVLFIHEMRTRVFTEISQLKMSYFDNQKKGYLMQLVLNETRYCYSLLKVTLNMILESSLAFVYTSMMLFVSYKFTFFIGLISAFYVIQNFFMAKLIKKSSLIYTQEFRHLTTAADEGIGGAKQIKLLGNFHTIIDRFSNSSRVAGFANRKSGLLIEAQTTLSSLFAIFSFLGLILYNHTNHTLILPELLGFLYLVRGLFTSLSGFNQKYGMLNTSIPAVNNVIDFLKASPDKKEGHGSKVFSPLLTKNITMKNLNLNYGEYSALKNINLTINSGQTVALVGESGAGKTSLVNLLPRLYEAGQGSLLIDEHQIGDISLEHLRDKIAFVNQDITLFNCSVKENLLMANKRASMDEIIEATKAAHAHDFINELPDKYDTIIGDRGVKLSGGQRQRLNIAQAFLKKAEIVILDEATSALDSKSEKFIQKALLKLEQGRTCLIIAHRLSTIQHADKIVIMERGEIVEEGTWDSLSMKNGRFKEMLSHQSFKS